MVCDKVLKLLLPKDLQGTVTFSSSFRLPPPTLCLYLSLSLGLY